MSESSLNPVSGDDGFVRSAGGQLAKFAIYAVAGLGMVIYLLSFVAGEAGSTISGNAIDYENNAITIALREEPPQLDANRATDASSNVVLAHVMEGLLGYYIDAQLVPCVA